MQGEEAIVKCGTSKGPIVMLLHRDWSPNGYDRATELFEKVSVDLWLCIDKHCDDTTIQTKAISLFMWWHSFYDGSHVYRAVPGFLVQFGIT
jgi:cyclophilin family peptidyl-prolyl cis-trans isomerase